MTRTSFQRRRRTKGNGQGSVEQLPSGKWRWRLTISRPGCEPRRISGVARTKSEAHQALARSVTERERGTLLAGDRLSLGQWLDGWIEGRQSQVSATTHDMYSRYLRLYVPTTLRVLRLQDIRTSQLRALDAELLGRGLSSATRGKTFSLLRSAFEAAIEDGHLVHNPARALRVQSTQAERQQQKRKALDEDELSRFMTAAEGHALYPLLYTLFSLGLRRGEVLGLRWRDLDLTHGTVKIEQQVKLLGNRAVVGPLKTESSRRVLYASDDLLDVLRTHLARQAEQREMLVAIWPETGLVFTSAVGTLLDPHNVNRAIAAICTKAGMPRFGSHTGRHTHISHRLKAGEQIEVVRATATPAPPPAITAASLRTRSGAPSTA